MPPTIPARASAPQNQNQNPTPTASTKQTTNPNTEAEKDGDDEDTSMLDASTTSKKRKRKSKTHILYTQVYKLSEWSYLWLELITPGTSTSTTINLSTSAPLQNQTPKPETILGDIDALTVSTLLQTPLSAYLGLTGSSTSFDILKTSGREAWIRVRRQDARAVKASLAGWMGSCESVLVPGVEERGAGGRVKVAWRIRGSGEGGVGWIDGDTGGDLFTG